MMQKIAALSWKEVTTGFNMSSNNLWLTTREPALITTAVSAYCLVNSSSFPTGQRADQWTEEKLFQPIGIDDYYWKITPQGEVDTEGGLYLSTYDLARIGYLFLNEGMWDGKRIISKEWVDASISPVVEDIRPDNDKPDTGYGYQWWVPNTGDEATIFAGNGYGGQFLQVVPEYDLVVVFNGWNIHEKTELSSWRALQDRILPAAKRDS